MLSEGDVHRCGLKGGSTITAKFGGKQRVNKGNHTSLFVSDLLVHAVNLEETDIVGSISQKLLTTIPVISQDFLGF